MKAIFKKILKFQIDRLENENRALKEGLVEKSTEFQQRVDELVKELDRYGELVDKLQTKINHYEQNKVPIRWVLIN